MEQNNKNYIVMKVVIMLVIIIVIISILGGTLWYVSERKNKEEKVPENIINKENSIQESITEDKVAPVLTGIMDREINIGEQINILEGIEAKDNIDEQVDISFEGQVDTSKAGEYIIKVIAKDDSGNISEQTFKVIVNGVITEKTEDTKNNTEKVEDKKDNNITSSKNDNTSSSTTPSIPNISTRPETPSVPSGPATPPTLTGTETSTELTNTEVKYGVKIKTYTTTIYNVYSDGSRTVKSTSNKVEYDRSNYSATTSELLAEAKSAKSKYSSMINQVVSNTNAYRQEANQQVVDGVTNRTNLVLDNDLCVAACVRAVEMAYSKKFDHTRPNGSNCFTVVKEIGISYRFVGENIAKGQTSAASVSKSWKNSAGHYSNMITSDFTKIGVGVFKLDGEYYWVQLFT